MTFNELISKYMEYQRLRGEVSKSLLNKINRLRREFGDLEADCHGNLFAERAKEIWQNEKPGTADRYLRQARAVRNWGVRQRLIGYATPIPLPYVNDTRYVEITPHQIRMILALTHTLYPWAYPTLLLLTHTGARLSEAMSIEPKDIRNGTILIRKPVGRRSKTIERVIPLTQELSSCVSNGGKFFVTEKGNRIESNETASKVFGKVLKDVCSILGYEVIRVHDLRHAMASLLASHGADLGDIASVLGHSNLQMTMRYRGLVRGKVTGIINSI